MITRYTKYVFESGGTLTITFNHEHESKILETLELLMSNSMAIKWINQFLFRRKQINIHFGNIHIVNNGRWLPEHNRIDIKDNLTLIKLLQTLVFELCNAMNMKFDNIALDNFIDANHYAEFIEEGEYYSFCLAYELYKFGMTHANWPIPDDVEQYVELLSKEKFMAKAFEKFSNDNSVDSHFSIYTTFFNQNIHKYRTQIKQINHQLVEDKISYSLTRS